MICAPEATRMQEHRCVDVGSQNRQVSFPPVPYFRFCATLIDWTTLDVIPATRKFQCLPLSSATCEESGAASAGSISSKMEGEKRRGEDLAKIWKENIVCVFVCRANSTVSVRIFHVV